MDNSTQAIIIYDAANYKGESERKNQKFKNLEVIFSDQGQSADERILAIVKKLKSKGMQITVVSSDREIQNVIFSKNVFRMSAREFAFFINQNNEDMAKQIAQTTNNTVKEKHSKTEDFSSPLEKSLDSETYEKLLNLRNKL